MALHKNVTLSNNHTIHAYAYADEATLLAATGFLSTDVGKVARQVDNGAFWVLQNHSPITWAAFADAGSVPVPDLRVITAGAGLTGGGDLSADRTIDVGANADGSITVNANDIQVGILATDAQHGTRGGGTQHSDVTTSVAGFQSAADKTKQNDTSRYLIQFGNDEIGASTTTRYLTPGYGDTIARTTVIGIDIPLAGTLRNFRVRHNITAGNGNNIVYTVMINGVASSIVATVPSTSAQGSDITNTAAVVAGDRIDIRVTKATGVATSPEDVVVSLDCQQ